MDISKTIEPRSDQLNADDLMTGPVTVTIEKVSKGDAEQPVNVHLEGYPGRPFKPSKSMRRVMVAAWGPNAAEYAGRSMTLYRDPSIKFGKDEVGGIRISHLSHIDKRLTLALTVTRGRRQPFTVDVLDTPTPSARAATGPSLQDLFALMQKAGLGDRDVALKTISGVIGRDIESSKELTEAEIQTVFTELEALEAGGDSE